MSGKNHLLNLNCEACATVPLAIDSELNGKVPSKCCISNCMFYPEYVASNK